MIKIDENTYNKMPEEIKKCFMLLPNKSKEEVEALFPYSKAGEYKGEGTKSGGIWSKSTGQPAGREYGDSGSASRFFYVAKASQEERNFGLSGFEEKYESVDLPIEIENDIKRLLNL